ncbi:MAG TPA: serine/threonine-protein kinase [Pirellulales bacterium]|nr:serine/threonine-protein kinase [Pirellulales bacterium]
MTNADCNLLYGLLARLFNFVAQPEVRSALDALAEQPDKPLGQILLEQGALDAQQRAALDALSRQYLALHENDPAQCLAALTVHPLLQAELARLREPAADQTQLAGQTFDGATLALVTGPASGEAAETDFQIPASSRFRILRPHAQGGLGEVFVAHDEELRREVALKQLRDRHADAPETRARFMLEAEVTGGLEHPGIVPVYSLGRDPEGRPFYAMRFIRGDSLKQAVDRFHRADGPDRDPGERAIELRKLLRRFIDVCNAIEYAHSRGVIHRDLKPDNIMLGAFGETLVVDWGLAKPLRQKTPAETVDSAQLQPVPDQDTTRTQMGSAVGTPAFMSPEQAEGKLDRLGPASDIYSLGATLYYLLTGRSPVEETGLLKLLLRVQAGDFPRPREVNARVPPALEAICLKAMATRQEQRYPSARALAEELDRWLADEPVTAYRAAWHERLARWGRRHRRSVEVGAAALTIITGISIAASVLVHSAKLEVEQERDEVQIALAAETEARKQAKAALEAEREAKNEARRAIDNYVQLVAEDNALKDEQVQPLREQLLEDAQRYYQLLLEKNGPDSHARHDLAAAILRVGRLNDVTGSKAEALKAFEHARAAFQELADKHPDEPKYRSDLALCYRSLGVLESEAGQPQAALARFRQAVGISRRLVEEHPENLDHRRDLARGLHRMAEHEAREQEAAAAEKHFVEALRLREDLAAQHPHKANYWADAAESWQQLGRLQELALSQPQQVVKSYQQAVDNARRALDAAPRVRAYRQQLSNDYRRLSRALGQTPSALEAALASKSLWPGAPHELFAAACVLAACAPAKPDSPAQQALAHKADNAAAAALEEAVSAGFRLDGEAEQRLDELRLENTPTFNAAVEKLRRPGDR